jgi:hypothetical protein
MTDDIQALIDSLRRGHYEDATEKIALLSAALQDCALQRWMLRRTAKSMS